MQPTEEQQRIVDSDARSLVVEAGAGRQRRRRSACTPARVRAAASSISPSTSRSNWISGGAHAAERHLPHHPLHRLAQGGRALRQRGVAAGGQDLRVFGGADVPVRAAGGHRCPCRRSRTGAARWTHRSMPRTCRPTSPSAWLIREPLSRLPGRPGGRMCRTDGGDPRLLPHDGYLAFQMDEPTLRGQDLVAGTRPRTSTQHLRHVRRQGGGLVPGATWRSRSRLPRVGQCPMGVHEADQRLQLTRSFRFGEGLAQMANALLGHFKLDNTLRLVGPAGRPRACRWTRSAPSRCWPGRTRSCSSEAISFLSSNRRYHFVGGPEGYRMEKLLDAYHLWAGSGGLVRDPLPAQLRQLRGPAATRRGCR